MIDEGYIAKELLKKYLEQSEAIDNPKEKIEICEKMLDLLENKPVQQAVKTSKSHKGQKTADRPEGIPSLNFELTSRERELLYLLSKGFSNKQIADALSLSAETVKWYLKRLYPKLNVRNRAHAVQFALQNDLINKF